MSYIKKIIVRDEYPMCSSTINDVFSYAMNCHIPDIENLYKIVGCDIYAIADVSETGNEYFLGLIACKRIHPNLLDELAMSYFPQRGRTAYRIEILHYEKNVSKQDKINLIKTCIVDKNDSFVFLNITCENVLEDIDILEEIGFCNAVENENIYIKPPKTW